MQEQMFRTQQAFRMQTTIRRTGTMTRLQTHTLFIYQHCSQDPDAIQVHQLCQIKSPHLQKRLAWESSSSTQERILHKISTSRQQLQTWRLPLLSLRACIYTTSTSYLTIKNLSTSSIIEIGPRHLTGGSSISDRTSSTQQSEKHKCLQDKKPKPNCSYISKTGICRDSIPANESIIQLFQQKPCSTVPVKGCTDLCSYRLCNHSISFMLLK